MKLTYIANMGTMAEYKNKKILFDALHQKKYFTHPISGEVDSIKYKETPMDIYADILSGREPYDKIDIIFISHYHPDHCSSSMLKDVVKSYAVQNKKLNIVCDSVTHRKLIRKIYSEPEFGDNIKSEVKNNILTMLENNIYPIKYKLGEITNLLVEGMKIQAIPMVHEGEMFSDTELIAYKIEIDDKNILFAGDARIDEFNYGKVEDAQNRVLGDYSEVVRNPEYLIAPFPYVSTQHGVELLTKTIKPENLVICHLIDKEEDVHNWTKSALRYYNRNKKKLSNTVFLGVDNTQLR